MGCGKIPDVGSILRALRKEREERRHPASRPETGLLIPSGFVSLVIRFLSVRIWPMIRASSPMVLLLLAVILASGQDGGSPQNAERARPCAVHPVKGRMCPTERVLRDLLAHYVPPKLPDGADENSEVLLHVIVPRTGGTPAKTLAISGNPALMRSAIRAVHGWIFFPYVYQGEAVEMEGDLHIRFKTAK
jgi:hypothetical protein